MASLIPELWFFKIRTISGSKCSASRRLQKEEPTRHEASARNKAASRHSRRPERFRCVPGIHTPWKFGWEKRCPANFRDPDIWGTEVGDLIRGAGLWPTNATPDKANFP